MAFWSKMLWTVLHIENFSWSSFYHGSSESPHAVNIFQKSSAITIKFSQKMLQTKSVLPCSELEHYISSLSSSVDVNAVAWRSSRFGPSRGAWLSASVSWSVACDVEWLPTILVSNNTANCWGTLIFYCMSQRPRSRGFISPSLCFLSRPQSPFLVCLLHLFVLCFLSCLFIQFHPLIFLIIRNRWL